MADLVGNPEDYLKDDRVNNAGSSVGHLIPNLQ